MADTVPPDEDRRAGKKKGAKTGKVADFRYKRPFQSSNSGQSGTSGQPKSPGQSGKCGSTRKRGRNGYTVQSGARRIAQSDAQPGLTTCDQSGAKRKTDAADQAKAYAKHAAGKSHNTATYQHGAHNGLRGNEAYAALDLGTNNCRLLIARPSGPDFTVIDAFSRVVKLGEDLATTGRLSDLAMDRALGALSICADKLRRRNVRLARSVATEACRRAANGPAFIERVRQETGIALDIITAEEEARLAVLGCHILLEEGDSPAVIFDIGGGSTELVLLEPAGSGNGKIPRILDWQSVPWGVVSLTDTVGNCEDNEAARLDRYARMRQIVSESFAPFATRIGDAAKGHDIRLLGTSGTVTTLASLHLELPHYDRKAVDGLIVPSEAMRAISADLSGMSPIQRSELPCIGHDRADLVVAGCAILDSILDLWPARRLGVADRGIREGILRSLMAAERQSEKALEALHEIRSARS